MRHRKSGVKLNRTTSHRQAMFRNMVTSLFKHDRIKTTDAKAKELRRWADHVVTLAKRGDLHARRLAMSIVREKDVVHKISAERFGAVNGGYTRIIKIGRRPGDAAAMTLVELISSDAARPAKTKKSKSAQAPGPVVAEPVAPESESPVGDDAIDASPAEEAADPGANDKAPEDEVKTPVDSADPAK